MRRVRWGALGLSMVVVVGACGGHSASSRQPVADLTTIGPATTTPTSTTAPSAREQVISAHKAYEAAYTACATHPATCDMSALVVAGSPAAKGVASYMAGLARDGLRGRPSERTYYVYEAFTPADTSTQAVLRICSVDADVVYKPNSGPQGQDVIVNDRLDSDLGDWTFRFEDGAWKLLVSTTVTQWKGSNGCPPKNV